MDKKKRILNIILCLAIVLGSAFNGNVSDAKVQKKYYHTTLVKSSMDGIDIYIRKAKFSGNKMTTWGNFEVSNTGIFNKAKRLKVKKRTFILAPNCKCYSSGGVDPRSRVSMKYIKRHVVDAMSGLGFYMTVKNGKVIEMELAS